MAQHRQKRCAAGWKTEDVILMANEGAMQAFSAAYQLTREVNQ
jgi:hypothetical protein